jgi:ABC-type spermidine/putrescine transport system permease subunit II
MTSFRLNLGKAALAVPALLILAFLIVPSLALVPMSFSDSMVYKLIPEHPSLVQYQSFISSDGWISALLNSFKVAIGTALLATTLGSAAAFGLTRIDSRVRAILQGLFVLPQAVPSIVIAVAMYFTYSKLGINGSIIGIVMAHTAMALPFVLMIVGSAIHNLEPSLAEASRSLGSNSVRTFFRVTMPQVYTGVLGGALFAFHFSFDEVVLSLFLTGASTKTLPVKIWDGLFFEVSPILPAISSLLILIPIVLFVLFMTISANRNSRASAHASDGARPRDVQDKEEVVMIASPAEQSL